MVPFYPLWALGLGFRVLGLGFRVLGVGFRVFKKQEFQGSSWDMVAGAAKVQSAEGDAIKAGRWNKEYEL